MFDVIIHIPARNTYFHIYEGTGDNLLHEDVEAGCIDYLMYDQYSNDGSEIDGGQCLFSEHIQDICKSDDDFIHLFFDRYGDGLNGPYEVISADEALHRGLDI